MPKKRTFEPQSRKHTQVCFIENAPKYFIPQVLVFMETTISFYFDFAINLLITEDVAPR